MASLREIKDRIASVRSTLKITSAMKLVASSKLHKAQKAIEGLRPYADTFREIISELESGSARLEQTQAKNCVAIVAVASNTSLCGGFNVNAIKCAMETAKQLTTAGSSSASASGSGSGSSVAVKFFPIGKKMLEAVKKSGYDYEELAHDLLSHPSYEKNSAFALDLIQRYMAGEFSKVVLVFNAFVSASTQRPHAEQFLPYGKHSEEVVEEEKKVYQKYLYEPKANDIAQALLPQLLRLQFHAAILDSVAAEHAARTIAMQTATDNAEKLLSELTLEYNKGRQQKITNEILDLVGGSLQ